MRNLFEDAIARQAQRLGARGEAVTRDELMTLEPADITAETVGERQHRH